MCDPSLPVGHTGPVLVMIDLDNTLNDRASAVTAWIDEFCAERGLPLDAPAWMETNDQDGYGDRLAMFGELRLRYGIRATADELVATYRAGVRRHLREVPGARRCLADLRRAGRTVVIVSNGAGPAQQHKIDALGFRSLVDAVVVSDEVGVAKPRAEIFELAAERVGLPLKGAWMVGDSPHHDIGGAQAIGLSTVWIHRQRPWNPDLPRPTAVIGSLAELGPVLATGSAWPRAHGPP